MYMYLFTCVFGVCLLSFFFLGFLRHLGLIQDKAGIPSTLCETLHVSDTRAHTHLVVLPQQVELGSLRAVA